MAIIRVLITPVIKCALHRSLYFKKGILDYSGQHNVGCKMELWLTQSQLLVPNGAGNRQTIDSHGIAAANCRLRT